MGSVSTYPDKFPANLGLVIICSIKLLAKKNVDTWIRKVFLAINGAKKGNLRIHIFVLECGYRNKMWIPKGKVLLVQGLWENKMWIPKCTVDYTSLKS